jgi:hypothetical protein
MPRYRKGTIPLWYETGLCSAQALSGMRYTRP